MNNQLKHIFDNSTCLSQRQLKDYVSGVMTNEESHAAEVHLNSCPLCSEAVDGLFAQKEGDAVGVMAEMDSSFLKEHFSLSNPQVHLNSLAPAQPVMAGRIRRRKPKAQPIWRTASIAAVLLAALGIMWFMENGSNSSGSKQIAQKDAVHSAASVVPTDVVESQPLAAAETEEEQNTISDSQEEVVVAGDNPQRPVPVVVAENSSESSAIEKEAEQKQTIQKSEVAAPVADMAKAAAVKEPANTQTPYSGDNTAAANLVAANNESKFRKRNEEEAGTTVVNATMEREEASDATEAANAFKQGEKLYGDKKYSAALAVFSKEMNSGSKTNRQQAAIMAARCYIALGQKDKAERLLQSIVDEGGPEKRSAKRMLRDIEE